MIKAPDRHTSINFCSKIKDNWSDFLTYISAKGMANVNQHLNVITLEDYNNNYAKYMGRVKPDVTIDYMRDTMDIITNKIKYFSDGQVYDDFKIISNARKFLQNEIKNRGMSI